VYKRNSIFGINCKGSCIFRFWRNMIIFCCLIPYTSTLQYFQLNFSSSKHVNIKKVIKTHFVWHTWIEFCMFYQVKLLLMHEYPSPTHCFNAHIHNRPKELLFLHINFSTCKLECSVIHSVSTLSAPVLALPTELLTISETTLVPTTTEVVPFKKTWNLH
jgi:hypothetical protein